MILAPRRPERFEEVAHCCSRWAFASGAARYGAANHRRRRFSGRYHRRTGVTLRFGRCGIRGRKPGSARRTQHHRAGAARRADHGRAITRRISATSSACFRATTQCASSGPAEFPLVLMHLLANEAERNRAGPPRSRDFAIADGRDRKDAARHLSNLLDYAGPRRGGSERRPHVPRVNPLSYHLTDRVFAPGTRSTTAAFSRPEAQRSGGQHRKPSVGGSGKTPFVLLLGELAEGARHEIRYALARLRTTRRRVCFWSIPPALPHDFGDEPLLMARSLRSRSSSGKIATQAGRFRREKVRTATASARRRLPAPRAGPRFRHRAGHSRGCSRPPASRGTACANR